MIRQYRQLEVTVILIVRPIKVAESCYMRYKIRIHTIIIVYRSWDALILMRVLDEMRLGRRIPINSSSRIDSCCALIGNTSRAWSLAQHTLHPAALYQGPDQLEGDLKASLQSCVIAIDWDVEENDSPLLFFSV
jgi:hypothetical protein